MSCEGFRKVLQPFAARKASVLAEHFPWWLPGEGTSSGNYVVEYNVNGGQVLSTLTVRTGEHVPVSLTLGLSVRVPVRPVS